MSDRRWIRADAQKPDMYEWVIGYLPGEDKCQRVREVYLNHNGEWMLPDAGGKKVRVTHWMRMPDGPTEGE